MTPIIIRGFDAIFSSLFLIVSFPLFIIIMFIIFLEDKKNPFFLQKRVGLEGKEFIIYKFRTMSKTKEEGLWAVKDDIRITKIGALLRSTHLDELPQLLNILIGDMTFVGPRPFRKKIINLILEVEPDFILREKVKPGLTGWSQIYGEKGESLEDHAAKLKHDLIYIKNGLKLKDYFKLLFKTFEKLLTQKSH